MAAANAVEGGSGALSDLAAHVELSENSLRVDPFAMRYLGGLIDGSIVTQIGEALPPVDIKARVRTLDLSAAFAALGQPAAATGLLNMNFAARGTGRAVAALLASLSGSVTASIHSGRLSNRVVNLAGQSIVSWVFEGTVDGGAPLVCFELSMNLENGVGKLRKLVVETDRVQFVGAGQLDLKTQSVDLTLVPRPKDRELVGTVGPIVIRGPLDAPEVSLAKGSVAGKVVGDTIGQPFRVLGNCPALAEHRGPATVPAS